MTNYKFDAIIWDCDGVLMDSEVISCTMSVKFFQQYGVKLTLKDYFNRFIGTKMNFKISTLEKESGIPLSKLITKKDSEKRDKEKLKAFTKDLQATKNIHKVLKSINLPMAIASGSKPKRLEHTLKLTKLYSFFENKTFSSELVKNGKPEPDIFLYAAKQLNVKPEKCLVIEDSTSGIKAAQKAGMTVFAFIGGSHINKELKEKIKSLKPNLIFNDMLKLPNLIET